MRPRRRCAAPGRERVPRFQRKLWPGRRLSSPHPAGSWALRGCGVRSAPETSGPRAHGSRALLAAARGRVAKAPTERQKRGLGRRAGATAPRRGPGSRGPGAPSSAAVMVPGTKGGGCGCSGAWRRPGPRGRAFCPKPRRGPRRGGPLTSTLPPSRSWGWRPLVCRAGRPAQPCLPGQAGPGALAKLHPRGPEGLARQLVAASGPHARPRQLERPDRSPCQGAVTGLANAGSQHEFGVRVLNTHKTPLPRPRPSWPLTHVGLMNFELCLGRNF